MVVLGVPLRRAVASVLALTMVLSLTMGVDSAQAAPDPRLEQLRDRVVPAIRALDGLAATEELLEDIPLVPVSLDDLYDLPAVTTAIAALFAGAVDPTNRETFVEELRAGVPITGLVTPDGQPAATGTLSGDLVDDELTLSIALERTVDLPLALLPDVVAYELAAVELTAGLEGELTFGFDLGEPDLDLTIRRADVGLSAAIDAEVAASDPFRLNVGILAVDTSGSLDAEVAVAASLPVAELDASTFVSTLGRDRFAVERTTASAALDLDLVARGLPLPSGGNLSGSIALAWDASSGPADWRDAISVDLGSLADFRSIVIEEVLAAVAQLAVTLRATQVSGVADLQLPFLREPLSQVLSVGEEIVDFLIDNGLGRIDDTGQVVLFEDIDVQTLIANGLTDVQGIVSDLAASLDPNLEPDLAYDPATKELTFGLAWVEAPLALVDPDLGAPIEDGAVRLRLDIADQLEAIGLSGLSLARDGSGGIGGNLSLDFAPQVGIALGLALDLSPDPHRQALELAGWDPDAVTPAIVAQVPGLDAFDRNAIRSVVDRLAIVTDGDQPSGLWIGVEDGEPGLVTGTATLEGRLGPLGVTVGVEDFAITPGSEGAPILAATFQAPDGRLTLTELFERLVPDEDEPDELRVVDAVVSAAVAPFTLGGAGTIGGLTLEGGVTVAWADITDPATLSITPDADFLEDLLTFSFSADPFALLGLLLQALDELARQVDRAVRDDTQLASLLPVVDLDLEDLVSELGGIRQALDALADDPGGTIQQFGERLNGQLVAALDSLGSGVVDPNAQLVSLSIDQENGGPPAVIASIALGVCGLGTRITDAAGCVIDKPVDEPFSLGLADALPAGAPAALNDLVSVDADGRLAVEYRAVATLEAGVQLPVVEFDLAAEQPISIQAGSTPEVFVLPSSGLDVQLAIDATSNGRVALGPFTIEAGSTARPGQFKLGAEVSFRNPSVTDGRVALSGLGSWLLGFEPQVGRGLRASCTEAFLPEPPEEDEGGEEGEEPAGPEEPDPDEETQTALVDACALVPLFLNGAYLGDVGFLAPDLLNPSGTADDGPWTAVYPDDLADKLSAALLDWRLLFQGLRYVVDIVNRGLDGASQGVSVPVIGDALDGGAEIAATLNGVLTQLDTFLFDPDEGATFGDLRQELTSTLNTAIPSEIRRDGVDPFQLIGQCVGGDCEDDTPIGFVEELEVRLALGQAAATGTPEFDLGFPGLRLDVRDPITATVGWELDLAFGLDSAGFYVRTDAPGAGDDVTRELRLGAGVQLPGSLGGDLALLNIELERLDRDAYGDELGQRDSGSALDRDVAVDVYAEIKGGTDGRLRLPQLVSNPPRSTFEVGASGNVDLRYNLVTSPTLPGVDMGDLEGALPSLSSDLLLKWSIGADTTGGFSGVNPPEAFGFRDVSIDMGEFVSEFLGPILAEVQRFTKPFQPILDTISAPIPGLSDLSVALGLGPVTMLTLFEQISGNNLDFIRNIIAIVELINTIDAGGSAGVKVTLGSFDLYASTALERNLPTTQRRNLFDDFEAAKNQAVAAANSQGGSGLLSASGSAGERTVTKSRSRTGGGFSFPAFENPEQLFTLLVGEDVVLARWDSGTLRAGFGVSYSFPPIFIGPVPLGFSLSAAASISGRFAIGYDTYGIRRSVEAFKNDQALEGVGLLFAGVFLDDWDENGVDVPEIVLSAEFAAGAGISLGVVSAGLALGVRATIDMNLRDTSGTGRIRIDQIIAAFTGGNPLCLFEVGGQLDIFLRAFVKFLFSELNFTIFEFTLLRLNDILGGICEPEAPVLATVVDQGGGSVLAINAGPREGLRNFRAGEPETITIRPLDEANTRFSVTMFGEYQEFGPVVGATVGGRPDVKVIAQGSGENTKIQLLPGTANEVEGADPERDEIDPEAPIATEDYPFVANAVLCGGGGDDTLVGGRGNDLLVGGSGCLTGAGAVPGSFNFVDNGAADGNDRLYGTGGNNVLLGLGGNDQLYGGIGVDLLVGGSGDDVLNAGSPGVFLDPGEPGYAAALAARGTQGDVLIGGSTFVPSGVAGSALVGGGITNTLVNSPGNDQLFGGDGDDTLIGDNGAVGTDGRVWYDANAARAGDDILNGGDGNDRLFGGPGDDELFGGRGNDLLDGGPGADTLVGGSEGAPAEDLGAPGLNVLVGGPGNDRLAAHHADVQRTVVPGATEDDPDRLVVTGVMPLDGSGPSSALLIGGSLGSALAGSGSSDQLYGGDGSDLLFGDDAAFVAAGSPLEPTAAGGVVAVPAGLNASAFATLRDRDADGYPTTLAPTTAAGGDDELWGGGGNDTLLGGPGDDLLIGGIGARRGASGTPASALPAGNDLAIGGPGEDLIIGDHGTVPRGGDGRMVGRGKAVEVTVLPASQPTSNRLIGGSWTDADAPGDDAVYAGPNGDVLLGDNGRVTVGGTVTAFLRVGGADLLVGGRGDDRLFGGPGDDELFGGAGDDHLEGGPGDDRLDGQGGDDVLIGGSSRPGVPAGDNLLIGGTGDDALAGDNARIERTSGPGLHGSGYLVELFDVPEEGVEPDPDTAGDDVLIGSTLGSSSAPSDDLLLGQGGDDLLVGDGARLVVGPDADAAEAVYGLVGLSVRWGRFVPIETGLGGDDHLLGGPGDDVLFGGPGADALIGGSSLHSPFTDRDVPADLEVHVVPPPLPAATSVQATDGEDTFDDRDVPSGDDLLVGGPGNDALAGDNARLERVATGGIDGGRFLLERYDRDVPGEDVVSGARTRGDDVLIGGRIGVATGSDDLLVGQAGDDLLIGDAATRVVGAAAEDAAADVYGSLGANARWGRFLPIDGDGLAGGRDRLEGGAGEDVLFGGPGEDLLLGGSDRDHVLEGWAAGDGVPPTVRLEGAASDDDVLVGGTGDDLLTGDNAEVSRGAAGYDAGAGVPTAATGAEADLYDVAYAGASDPPHPRTAGDDVVIGGSLGAAGSDPADLGDPGDDVGFGQGGDDLLVGDHARRLLGDDRGYAPLLGTGGDDHLEGGPGDDVLFGGDGDDLLLGGTSDRAVADAVTAGVVAGDDLLVGGPGEDVVLGDNGRLRRGDGLDGTWWPHPLSDPAQPWWWQDLGAAGGPLAGAAIEPFDEPTLSGTPHPATAGDDLVVGGSLRAGVSTEGASFTAALAAGLLGEPTDADLPGSDLLHGQAGDDALFGDDVLVRLDLLEAAGGWQGDTAASAWQSLRRQLADTIDGVADTWPLASLDTDGEGDPAAGGDDLILGGPDDDVVFGGPGQDDLIGGSWDPDRLDGRDQIDAGPGHDVAAGDNARIVRPLTGSALTCQTYRHRDATAADWQSALGGADAVGSCTVGVPDADADAGVFTRIERDVEMLDDDPNLGGDGVSATAGSDLIWGGDGDDTLIGQFDDTAAFEAASEADPFAPSDEAAWQGWAATRVVEWCRQDAAFVGLLDDHLDAFDGITADERAGLVAQAGTDPAGALAAYVGVLAGDGGAYDLDDIAIAGDVLCGGEGEDAILGDQGVVVDIVEDGGRERFIRPNQPFVSTTIFEAGTLTRETTLTQFEVGGDDLVLGGPGGDSLHGGAGDDVINGNAGIDVIFGGDGDDVIWGGRGEDHLYGGYGDDHLDVRPRPATASGWPGDPAAWFLFGVEADVYQGLDQIYGGWGADVMQADEGGNGPVDGDRLMDWGGVYNLSYVCAPTYGAWITIRSPAPGLIDYLLDKAEGHGAVDVRTEGSSGFNEIAMVYTRDIKNNVNPPQAETPGHFTCGSADPTRGPGAKDPLPDGPGGGGGDVGGAGSSGPGNSGAAPGRNRP